VTTATGDPTLLTIARRVLANHNFLVEERPLAGLGDVDWLLAESDYFVLGIAAGGSFDDLLVLEGYVASELGELLQQAEVGAKRWDFYVVLLARSGADQRGRPNVVRLEYNTRSMRRIVCLGTAAHEEAVANALATFLPLPEQPPGGLPMPFDELVEQLVLNGIPNEQAVAAVSGYRSSEDADA
jgi:hypothetical protein